MLSLLTPLASLLGIEAGAVVERMKKNAGLWAALAAFAAIALVFLLVAANAGLTLWIGPVWAPLVMAGVSAAVALIIYLVIRIAAGAARQKEAERRRSAETTALATTATITAIPLLLRSSLVRNVGIPVGVALAALFVLARSGRKPPESAK